MAKLYFATTSLRDFVFTTNYNSYNARLAHTDQRSLPTHYGSAQSVAFTGTVAASAGGVAAHDVQHELKS